MASNFLYSTRDQKFILKEWLDMSKVFEAGRFKGGYSVDDIDSILENAMLDIMYEIPSQSMVKEVVISDEVIYSKEKPIVVYENVAESA